MKIIFGKLIICIYTYHKEWQCASRDSDLQIKLSFHFLHLIKKMVSNLRFSVPFSILKLTWNGNELVIQFCAHKKNKG